MNNCGIIKLFGRFGDFGDRSSGVGGSMPICMSVEIVGLVGNGRSNGGVFLFGIPIWLECSSSKITLITPS